MKRKPDHEEQSPIFGAGSKDDIKKISKSGPSFFFTDGKPDPDKFIQFVVEYNEFINHQPRAFKRIKDHDMRL